MVFVDATCPLVSKVHVEAERHHKAGREIVLIGHAGHPEVIGTMGQLPDGAMQLFIRDPSNNLVEISSPPGYQVDPAIFKDELYEDGLYVSGRNDFRGYKSENATLYHGKK